jgi:hypothetical protein
MPHACSAGAARAAACGLPACQGSALLPAAPQDPARPLYRGSLDCLLQSVRAEGLLALYKGWAARGAGGPSAAAAPGLAAGGFCLARPVCLASR